MAELNDWQSVDDWGPAPSGSAPAPAAPTSTLGTIAKALVPAQARDIPSEIYKAGSESLSGMNDYLNPFSKAFQDANELRMKGEGSWTAPSTIIGGFKGLGSAAAFVGAPITGAARSIIGHTIEPFIPTRTPEEQKKLRETGMSEDMVPGATPEENYEKAKGFADTAMMGMRPAGAPIKVAPPAGYARGPYEISPTKPAYQWQPDTVPVPSAPTPNGPLGVTLSEGQATGELPLIQREQAALRGAAGETVQGRAQQFADQQKAQVEQAGETVARGLDPGNALIAENPQEAGQVVSTALSQKEALRQQRLDQQAQALAPPALPHPFDASDTVAEALRNSADTTALARTQNETALANQGNVIRSNLSPDRNVLAANPQEAADIISGAVSRAEEQARAARDAAYDNFRDQPGQFDPTAFRGVGNAVRRSLNLGDDPVILNSKVTPMVTPMGTAALQDLDRNLGAAARNALSPDTTSYRPFTPSVIDDARKRLLSFSRQANATARSTGDFSDVRAMGRITDAFDDVVQRALGNPDQFSGDGAGVADAMAQARGLHSELRNTFSRQGSGDKVGPIMQQIIGMREGQAALPNQIAQWLYGTGQTPVLMANRMMRVFGEGSPEVSALKQGLFSYITERPEGVTAWGPGQVADRIYGFVNGPGRTLAQTYFSPQEIRALTGYADNLRASVAQQRPPTDVVGRAIDRIVGSGGQGATSSELADTLFGRAGTGENPLGAKIAEHIRDTYGENSEPFNAMRDGMFSRLTGAENGRLGFDPEAAVGRIQEFLNGRGRPLSEALFSDKERQTLSSYADALRDHAEQSSAPKDPVDRAIAKIVGRDGPPATAREVADLLYSRSVARDQTLSLNLAKRLRDEFGATSPQWSAVKQGLFKQLVEPGEGMTDWGPGKIAQRINKFMNVDGVELAKEMFSPQERQMIQQYADLQRRIQIPQAGATSTFVAPMLKKISSGIATLVGAVIGHAVAPGFFGIGEIVGATVANRATKMIEDASRMRKISAQMPLVAQQIQKWQRAIAAANRANTPMSQTAVGVASANLAQSLQKIGITPRALVQGSVPAGADQRKQQKEQEAAPVTPPTPPARTPAAPAAITPATAKGIPDVPDGAILRRNKTTNERRWFTPDGQSYPHAG